MSATLSAGVNSVVLKLDTPYDTIRTSDVRDDLVKVKVWCSTTNNFTPVDTGNTGANQVFDGLSLSIVISKLADGTTLVTGTTYYVKYAFISEIDETVYTVSSQLSAIPVAATAQNVDISGYSAFVKSTSGTYTPTTATLTAILTNIPSPTYAWTITGGTLSATNTGSVTVTPNANVTSVSVSVSVTGPGMSAPIAKTVVMAVVNDGQNAASYWLTTSAAAIQRTKAGALNPATVTVTAYYAVGNTTPAVYAGRFKIYESGSDTALYTSAANESSKTYTPTASSITSIKAELYLAGGTTVRLDEQTVPVVVDGSDTVTAILSNESATLPADSTGAVSSFAGASTTMSVFIGATDDSANWTYAATKSGDTITFTEAVTSRTQTVSALTSTSAYVDIVASKTGYPNITKRFNVNKSLNGVPGVSSLVYDIVTSAPVIVKDAPNASTAGTYSTITIQGKKYDGNTTANYGWVTVTANGDTESTTATDTAAAAYSLTPAANSGKSSYTIKLYSQATVSGATLLDTQFVAVVYKGNPGDPGAPGNSTINAILSNGSHVFPADKDGAVTSYANSGTELRVYEGANELTYDGAGTNNSTWTFTTGTPINITRGTITDSGTYATIGVHSGVLAGVDSSAITYTITGKSSTGVIFTITQTQTFSKSKTGATSTVQGPTGASNHRAYKAFTAGSTQVAPANTTNGAAPDTWSLAPVSIAVGEAQYQTDGVTPAGSTTTTWSTPYPSYLKVGNLSAVSVNTGALTVTDTITVSGNTTDGVLIKTDGIYIYNGTKLRVKLGSI